MSFEEAYSILTDKLGVWYEQAVAMVPNVVVAVAVLIFFMLLAKLLDAILSRILRRVTDTVVVVRIATSIVKIATISVGLFAALGILQLQKTVTSLLAGAGIVGLAVGFAFQDLASNFIAGFLMGVRKPFRLGHLIETNNHLGFVRKMNLRNTLLENFSGQMIVIPNKEVFQNPVVNYSATGHRRIDIDVGVTYESDLQKVYEVAKAVVDGFDFTDPDKESGVYALEFGDSSINFSVRYWIEYPGDKNYFEAIHDGILAIKKAFDENDITIPFPIRTLDFREAPAHVVLEHHEEKGG